MTRRTQLRPSTACCLLAVLCAPLAGAQTISSYFSPHGHCATRVCDAIHDADESVLVQMFSLSHPRITASLIDAHRRGVHTVVIVNPAQQSTYYSTAHTLDTAGVRVLVDARHALQHNKSAVIDHQIVITGSMNWTVSGDERNAENLIVIDDPDTAAAFAADFRRHLDHSVPFVPRPPKPSTQKKPPPGLVPLPPPRPRKVPR